MRRRAKLVVATIIGVMVISAPVPSVGDAPAVAVAEVPACPTPAPLAHHDSPIGSDANVSVFVGGDYEVGGNAAESEGVLAVGGRADFAKERGGTFNVGVVGFGSGVAPPAGSDMLRAFSDAEVAGGTTVDVGHGIGGNVVLGGNAIPVSRFMTSGGAVSQQSVDPLGPFSDFGAVIAQRSAEYASLAPTGETSERYRVRTFQGDGISPTQVFSVSGDALGDASQAMSMRFAAIPEDARIIVNVTGSQASIFPAGFFTDASPDQIGFSDPRFVELATHVMWNFVDADDVTIGTGDQLLGSVLIPSADAHTHITASTNGRVLIGGDLRFAGDGNEAHAFPFPEDDFECKPTIDPPAEVGALELRKLVIDPEGVVSATQEFVGTWACTDVDGDAIPGGTWRAKSGETVLLSDTLPTGAACTVTESPPPSPVPDDPSYVWEAARITPDVVTVERDAVVGLVVTNTVSREVGGFDIAKRLDSTDLRVPADVEFSGSWICTVSGSTIARGQWNVRADEVQAVDGVPVGATCRVVEDPPGDPVPEDPGVIWMPAEIFPNEVVIGATERQEIVVTNRTEQFDSGFTISKSVSGPSGGFERGTPFEFTWTCSAPGGATFDGREQVIAGGVVPVEGIPTGSSCTVQEIDLPPLDDPSYSWETPQVSVGGAAPVTTGEVSFDLPDQIGPVVSVAWTNVLTQHVGVLAVQKVLHDPQRVVSAVDAYRIVWSCVTPGGADVADVTDVLADGAPRALALQLPYGTRCNLHEDLRVGSPAANSSLAFQWGIPVSDASEVVIGENGTEVGIIRLTNVVEAVSSGATIRKVVDAPDGAVPDDVLYTGKVMCESPDGAERTSQWSVRAGDTAVPLIDGLSDGTACTVTEDPPVSPGPDATWESPVVSPASFVVRAGSQVDVTVRNTAVASDTPVPPVDPPVTEPPTTPDPAHPGTDVNGSEHHPIAGLAATGAPKNMPGIAALISAALLIAAGIVHGISRRQRRVHG